MKYLRLNIKRWGILMNRIVFIDMDGVIADYWCAFERVNVSIEEINTEGFFLDKKPVQPIIDAINKVFADDDMYILSACPSAEGVAEKNEWLDKYFNIEQHKRCFVDYPFASKAEFIEDLEHNLDNFSGKEIIMVDDHHDILKECESCGYISYHPSHVLVMAGEID